MSFTTKKKWRFYVEDFDGNQKQICIKECKKPERLNLWKRDMQRWLWHDQPFADFTIYGIGYQLIENNIAV